MSPTSSDSGDFSTANHFVEVLSHWAAREPEGIAFRFCAPEGSDPVITYTTLHDRVLSLAGILQERGLAGKRIVLLYPSGLDFIIGFLATLAAGSVAVPSDLPRRREKGEQLLRIIRDSTASLILSVTEIAARFDPGGDLATGFSGIDVLATDLIGSESLSAWRPLRCSERDLALIQYTSGSTSEPRGVMLSHENLVKNCRMIMSALGLNRSHLGVSWLPACHDMGLVGGILTPLYGGKPGLLLSPSTFLANPLSWLRAISQHHVHVSGGPDFGYAWCVDRISSEQLEGIDLSGWKVAYTGAEAIRPDTLTRFAEKFSPYGFSPEAFFPCYGLAEATLMVCGGPPGKAVTVGFDPAALGQNQVVHRSGGRELCASGQLLPGVKVAFVDPHSGVSVSPDTVGEIWVQAPTVGLGYWGNGDSTRETFAAGVPGHEGTFLRTGDLGFLHEGNLFVTGRLKDLLIVRGVNWHPQDLEKSCESASEAVVTSGSAAFSVEREGREWVVLVAEMTRRRDLDGPAEIQRIRQGLVADHDLAPNAVVLVRAGSLPRTSSGKIRRFLCRERFETDQLEALASWPPADDNETRMPLSGLLALVSAHTGADPKQLDRSTRLAADLGLDSLGRVALAHRIEKGLGMNFPAGSLGGVETLADLSTLIERSSSATRLPDESSARFDHFPEITRLRQIRTSLVADGFPDPYFRLHEEGGPGMTRVDGRNLIQFGSYNYLGLSGHPEVSAAACEAVRRYGTSSGASRLVSGNRAVHETLEHALADFLGVEGALVFVGGHATNETTLGHLFGPGDLILHDGLAHNSLIEGARLSGARRWSFAHNDTGALDVLLTRHRHHYRRVLLIVEGVYSMDGDLPDLERFVELKRKHACLLMIDEAHSLGTLGATGRGLTEHSGVAATEIDILMGTLSKTLASCGGFIAGSRALVDYLRYTAPGFVYSVGMPPASAAAASTALSILRHEPERVLRLQGINRFFHEEARTRDLPFGGSPDTPIAAYRVGSALATLTLAQQLFDSGINVPPVLPPAVPEDGARLRFFLTSEHGKAQITTALDSLQGLTNPHSSNTRATNPSSPQSPPLSAGSSRSRR